MKRALFCLLAAAAVLGFSGCETLEKLDPLAVARRNVRNSKRLRIGMTKTQVLAIMGEPVKNESFNQPDVWYYYVRMNWGDGFITEDECIPLLFKDGRLLGWGNDFYTAYRLQRKDRMAEVELPAEPAESMEKPAK